MQKYFLCSRPDKSKFILHIGIQSHQQNMAQTLNCFAPLEELILLNQITQDEAKMMLVHQVLNKYFANFFDCPYLFANATENNCFVG